MLEIILMTNGVRTTVHGTQNTASLSEEVNLSSKLEFKVSYLDESFNNVFPKLTRVIAFDTVPSDVVFEGYVYSVTPKSTQSGEISKTVACVHILSKLNDAAVVGFEDASGNISTMAGRILGIYNTNARDEDQIELGYCPIDGGHNEVVHIFSATCLDALTQLVVTDAGWSFRTRYYEGKWYLDISDDFGEMSDMDMIFGVNLIDVSQELDSSELYTRIIPIGGASHIPDGFVNPQMSLLHDPEGMPLTLYNYDNNNPDKIYVANTELEKKYPIIAKVVQYDDIAATDDTDYHTAQGNLLSRATADAAKLTDIVESYKASALDLARAGYDFSLIELNKMYRIVNNKLDIDTYLQVTSKKTNYDNPAKCELTFGKVGVKSSKWMSRKGKTTDQKVNAVGSTSYKTTNTRMGGMSMRNTTKSSYDGSTHDANTLYTVSDAGTGKVEMYLGDTKISGEGGGWEVENAVLYDAANLHDYTVDTTLMADISANTKLYYGASGRMIVAQGMLFYQGSNNLSDNNFTNALDDLLTENSAYIAPEYSGIISYRYTNNVAYRLETDVKVYLEQVDYPSGRQNRARMWFKIAATTKETNLSTSTETTTTTTTARNFYTSDLPDVTEYGLLLVSTSFGENSPVTQLEQYIPNGYVGANLTSSSSGVFAMLVYKNDSASIDKWNAAYNGTINPSSTYASIKVGYLMPLSANETILALGATKRTEPQGGGN